MFAEQLTAAFSAYVRREGGSAEVARGRTIRLAVSGVRKPEALERYAGTHRIQRIPKNGGGRRHTSTATVAVLADAERERVKVDRADVDVEVFKGSGPGGQHRNKTASCARVIHRPTGLVVTATASRSQWENIEHGIAEVERRLNGEAEAEASEARNGERRTQIRSGERSVKQWTWNDQRGEVVDHATGHRFSMAAFLRGRLT